MHDALLLGLNIDHVATLRQARGEIYPEPVHAALLAEQLGADSITLHLREDRRHIQDRDVEVLRGLLQTRMNLEMAVTEEMLGIAERIQPQDCCLVPEKREELTTEGGLDVLGQEGRMMDACARMREAGVRVSLFIDADQAQIDAAVRVAAPVIEIHTGHYASARGAAQQAELQKDARSQVIAEVLDAVTPVLQAISRQLAADMEGRVTRTITAELERLCLAGIDPTCRIAANARLIQRLSERIEQLGLNRVTLLPGTRTEITFDGGRIAIDPVEITDQIAALLAELSPSEE